MIFIKENTPWLTSDPLTHKGYFSANFRRCLCRRWAQVFLTPCYAMLKGVAVTTGGTCAHPVQSSCSTSTLTQRYRIMRLPKWSAFSEDQFGNPSCRTGDMKSKDLVFSECKFWVLWTHLCKLFHVCWSHHPIQPRRHGKQWKIS